ncbi:hypothetical protein FC831_17160 [Clostridium botulinum]|nr:hypothetical protein [Clostridium botulinum]
MTVKKETKTIECQCKDHKGKNPLSVFNFYSSNSVLAVDGKATICKKCIKEKINYNDIQTIYDMLMALDIPFIYDVWITAENSKNDTFGKYISLIGSLSQYASCTSYKQSVFEPKEEMILQSDKKTVILERGMSDDEYLEFKLNYKKNKDDTIRLLGYDPFEAENETDKPNMYAKLTNMINEDILQDGLKTSAIISIIKGQNQENKMNDLITYLSSDTKSLLDNIGTIKSLTDTKEKLNKSILALAKDNKISDLYSGVKTVGQNTLTGKLKKVRELDLDEAQVNLFDIRTSMGMYQVAKLSAEAQRETLNFGDDDLLDMVKFQKDKLAFYNKEYEKLREENRKLRVLCTYNNLDYKDVVFEEEWKDFKYEEEEKLKIQQELECFDKLVETVEPLNLDKYADKIIEENEKKEKERILNEIK